MKTRIACTLLILALVATCGAGAASAQGIQIDWSPPTNLSNTPASSNHPAIAADAAGNVHVVWAEDVGGKSILGIPQQGNVPGNWLVYTRWDGFTWSEPVDIIAVPGDSLAAHPVLAADSQGFLHVVWTGVYTIYYSRALASQAVSSRAWYTPIAIGSSARTAWESAVAVDNQNTVHILYADREVEPAVIHVSIPDCGRGETTSTWLSLPLQSPDEAAFARLSLKVDPKGRLHAAWGTVGADGNGKGLYYARSVDGGETWSKAFRLAWAEGPGVLAEWASVGIVGDSELHMIYVYPENDGRQERISLDGGETWGEAHTIYPDLEGIAGVNVQVTDAAGNLHVLSNLRTHDQVGGLIYWRWLGDEWSAWQWANIEGESTGLGGHWTAAAVRLGNEIHALWNTNFSDQAGEVWHVSGVIPDVAAQQPVTLPTEALPQATEQPDLPRPSPSAPTAQGQATLTPSSKEGSGGAEAAVDYRPPQVSDTASALLLSLVPALVLVLGVVVWHLVRKR